MPYKEIEKGTLVKIDRIHPADRHFAEYKNRDDIIFEAYEGVRTRTSEASGKTMLMKASLYDTLNEKYVTFDHVVLSVYKEVPKHFINKKVYDFIEKRKKNFIKKQNEELRKPKLPAEDDKDAWEKIYKKGFSIDASFKSVKAWQRVNGSAAFKHKQGTVVFRYSKDQQ